MRILLVEDDQKVAGVIARRLSNERYLVDIAPDGVEGLQRVDGCNYDLMIVDLLLPRLTGTELLRQVRQSRLRLPIMILSGRAAVEDKVLHLEMGADDYLTKPFGMEELILRVKSLLRKGPFENRHVMRVQDLELNRLTREVRRAGRSVILTCTEYILLEFMMASTGQVLSRSKILHHVWDPSFDGVTTIVDVYVRYLRRKIDDPFPLKLIHTVRGMGYCVRSRESEGDGVSQ